MNTREIFLVAAVAANGVIGADGTMPWHIPADLRHFKSLTNSLPMIMGRKTFESLPGLLPGRRHIVITSNNAWEAEGAEVAHGIEAAIALANAPHIAVIGGAQIYAMALPFARRIELTKVQAEFVGDTFMPPLGEGWREVAREVHKAEHGRPGFAFVTLVRDL